MKIKAIIKYISTTLSSVIIVIVLLLQTGCGNSGCRSAEEQYYKGVWEDSQWLTVKPLNNNVIQQENSITGNYTLTNGTTEAFARENRWYPLRMNNKDASDAIVKSGQLLKIKTKGFVNLTGFSETIDLKMKDWIGLNGGAYNPPSGKWTAVEIPQQQPVKKMITFTHNADGTLDRSVIYTVKAKVDGKNESQVEVPVYGKLEEAEKIQINGEKNITSELQTNKVKSNKLKCIRDDNGIITECQKDVIVESDDCRLNENVEQINYMWLFVKQIRISKWPNGVYDAAGQVQFEDVNIVVDNPVCKITGGSNAPFWYECTFNYNDKEYVYKRRVSSIGNGQNYPQFEEQIISNTDVITNSKGQPLVSATSQIGNGHVTRETIENLSDDEMADLSSVKKHFVMCIKGGTLKDDNFCPDFAATQKTTAPDGRKSVKDEDGNEHWVDTVKEVTTVLFRNIYETTGYSPIRVVFKNADEIFANDNQNTNIISVQEQQDVLTKKNEIITLENRINQIKNNELKTAQNKANGIKEQEKTLYNQYLEAQQKLKDGTIEQSEVDRLFSSLEAIQENLTKANEEVNKIQNNINSLNEQLTEAKQLYDEAKQRLTEIQIENRKRSLANEEKTVSNEQCFADQYLNRYFAKDEATNCPVNKQIIEECDTKCNKDPTSAECTSCDNRMKQLHKNKPLHVQSCRMAPKSITYKLQKIKKNAYKWLSKESEYGKRTKEEGTKIRAYIALKDDERGILKSTYNDLTDEEITGIINFKSQQKELQEIQCLDNETLDAISSYNTFLSTENNEWHTILPLLDDNELFEIQQSGWAECSNKDDIYTCDNTYCYSYVDKNNMPQTLLNYNKQSIVNFYTTQKQKCASNNNVLSECLFSNDFSELQKLQRCYNTYNGFGFLDDNLFPDVSVNEYQKYREEATNSNIKTVFNNKNKIRKYYSTSNNYRNIIKNFSSNDINTMKQSSKTYCQYIDTDFDFNRLSSLRTITDIKSSSLAKEFDEYTGYNEERLNSIFITDKEQETIKMCNTTCLDLCVQYFYTYNPGYSWDENDQHFAKYAPVDVNSQGGDVSISNCCCSSITHTFQSTGLNNSTHRSEIINACKKANVDENEYGAGWYGLYAKKLNNEGEYITNYNISPFSVVKYTHYYDADAVGMSSHCGAAHKISYNICTPDSLNQGYCSKLPTQHCDGNPNCTSLKSVKYQQYDLDEACPNNCIIQLYQNDGYVSNEEKTKNSPNVVANIDYLNKKSKSLHPRRGAEAFDSENTLYYSLKDDFSDLDVAPNYNKLVGGLLPVASQEVQETECYDRELPIEPITEMIEYIPNSSDNNKRMPTNCTVSGYHMTYEIDNNITFNSDNAGILPIKWAGYQVKPGDVIPISIDSSNPILIKKMGAKPNSEDINDYMPLIGGSGLMVYIESAKENEPSTTLYTYPNLWQCNMGMGGSYGYYLPYKYSPAAGQFHNPREIETMNNLWWDCESNYIPIWFTGYDYKNVKTGKPVYMHTYNIEELKKFLPEYKPSNVEFDRDTVEYLGCNASHVPTEMSINGRIYVEENIELAYDNTEGAMYKYRDSQHDSWKTIKIDDPSIVYKTYSKYEPKIIQVSFKDNNDSRFIYHNVTIKAKEYKKDTNGNTTSEIKNNFNNLRRIYDSNAKLAYYEFDYTDGHHKIPIESADINGIGSCYLNNEENYTKITLGAVNSFKDYNFKENDEYYILNGDEIFTRFGPFTGFQEQTSGLLLPAIYQTHGMCRGIHEFIYDTHELDYYYGDDERTGSNRERLDHYWRIEFNTPDLEDEKVKIIKTEDNVEKEYIVSPDTGDGKDAIEDKTARKILVYYDENDPSNGKSDGFDPCMETMTCGISSHCIDKKNDFEPCSTSSTTIPDIFIVDLSKTNNHKTNPSLSGTVVLYKDYNNINFVNKKYYLVTHKDSYCDIDWKNEILDKDDTRISKITKDGYPNPSDNERGIQITLTINGKECVIDDNEDTTSISTVLNRKIYTFIYNNGSYSIEQDIANTDINHAVCYSDSIECKSYLTPYLTGGRFKYIESIASHTDEGFVSTIADKCKNNNSNEQQNQYSYNSSYYYQCLTQNINSEQLSLYRQNCESSGGEFDYGGNTECFAPENKSCNNLNGTSEKEKCENAFYKYITDTVSGKSNLATNFFCCYVNKNIKTFYNLDKAPYILSCGLNGGERDKSYSIPYSLLFQSEQQTNFTNPNQVFGLKSNISSFITNPYFARCVPSWSTPKWMLMSKPGDPSSFYTGFNAISGTYIGNHFTKQKVIDDYSGVWSNYGGIITNAVMHQNCQYNEETGLNLPCTLSEVNAFNAEFTTTYPRQFILVKTLVNDPINTSSDECKIEAKVNGEKVASHSLMMNEPFGYTFNTKQLPYWYSSKQFSPSAAVVQAAETVNGKGSDSGNFFKASEITRNWIGAGVLRPEWHVLKANNSDNSYIFEKDKKISFETQGTYRVSGNLSNREQAYCMIKGSQSFIEATTAFTGMLAMQASVVALSTVAIPKTLKAASIPCSQMANPIAAPFATPICNGLMVTFEGILITIAGLEVSSLYAMIGGNDASKYKTGGSMTKGRMLPDKQSYSKRNCGVGTAFQVVALPPFACLSSYSYHCTNKRIDKYIIATNSADSVTETYCQPTKIPSWSTTKTALGSCIKEKHNIDNGSITQVAQRYKNDDKKINSLIDSPMSDASWDERENVFEDQCGLCAKSSSVYSYGGIYYYIDTEDPKELSEVKGLYNSEHCANYTNEKGENYNWYTNLTFLKPFSNYTTKQKTTINKAIIEPLNIKLSSCDSNYQNITDLSNESHYHKIENAFLKAQIRNRSSSVSQIVSIYATIVSESQVKDECKTTVLDELEKIANIGYNNINKLITEEYGNTYDVYSFTQNLMSATCNDNKKGRNGAGLEPEKSDKTTYTSVTRMDQDKIMAREGYGELLSDVIVSDADNSVAIAIPTTINGKSFKRAKIGFAYAGVDSSDPMYLYKDFKRQNASDLERGYSVTLGNTSKLSKGKYLYFFIQPLNDQGRPNEVYNPNTIFSPSKTEFGDDYDIAQSDLTYSFKDYDVGDEGEITLMSPRTGKLWFTILDSKQLAGGDQDADGKIIQFDNDEDPGITVNDSNVLATNSGSYQIFAKIQTEVNDGIQTSTKGIGLNNFMNDTIISPIKEIFIGKYNSDTHDYNWKDGVLGKVANAFLKIHLLYVAWFMAVLFSIIIISFNFVIGKQKFDFKFMKPYLMRYALIMAFVNPQSIDLYLKLFVKPAFYLAEGLSAYVSGAFTSTDYNASSPNTFASVAFGPVDQIIGFWLNKYTLEKMLAIIFSSWPGIICFVLLLMCFIFFMINVVEASILYIVILVKMSLYLSIGPVVFIVMVHEKTAGKFTEWWKMIAGCIAEQVCMFAALACFATIYYHILKGSMNFIYCWEPVIKIPILDITLFSMWRISGTMPAHMAELAGTMGDDTGTNTKGFNILTAFMLFILSCMMSKFVSKASTFGAKWFGQESSMPKEVSAILDKAKSAVKSAPSGAIDLIKKAREAKKDKK